MSLERPMFVWHEYSLEPCLLPTFAKTEDVAHSKENINGAVYLCSWLCHKTNTLQSRAEQGGFSLLFLSVPKYCVQAKQTDELCYRLHTLQMVRSQFV
jgi:hypothetical protein